METLTSNEIAQALMQSVQNTVEDAAWDTEELAEGMAQATVITFEERMVMTYDDGFVIRLRDGSEFQVTVRQSN
jgi:hypothetical protein